MAKFDLLIKPSYLADRSKLSGEIQLKLKKCEELLVKDVRHPSLQTKRVQQQDGLFEARVDQRYRVLYCHEGPIIQLLAVGPHDVLEQRLRVPTISAAALAVAKRPMELAAEPGPVPMTMSERDEDSVKSDGPGGAPLPAKINPELLQRLGIPDEWQGPLLACASGDAWFDAQVPDACKCRLLEYFYPSIGRVLEEPALEVTRTADLQRHSEPERPPMAFARHSPTKDPVLDGGHTGTGASRVQRPRPEPRGRVARWTLSGYSPEERAEQLYAWLISEVDAGRSTLCTYKAGVAMVLHYQTFTPAYLGQLLRLAVQCGERPIEGLGRVRLDTFLVNQSYRPGDGHWACVNYSEERWNGVFTDSPAIE